MDQSVRSVAAVLAVLSALLAGCATMSPEQCLSVDWASQGYEDASAGHGPQRLGQHGRACEKAGVVPDEGAWAQGYRDGLPAFCVGAQGYALGARNGSYYSQCPRELEDGFLDGYRLGQDVYDLAQRIAAQDQEISRLRDSMDDDDASEASREADGRWLDHAKRERSRLEQQRWEVQARARERGYPSVW
jgi:hypothetical protein